VVGNIPVAGLALLLGIDRFMSEARAITNLIGNGVASVAVSKWEGELDLERARYFLDNPGVVEEEEYLLSRVPAGAGVPYEA
jgi:aerobic C4-dicarboxylate transport protein